MWFPNQLTILLVSSERTYCEIKKIVPPFKIIFKGGQKKTWLCVYGWIGLLISSVLVRMIRVYKQPIIAQFPEI